MIPPLAFIDETAASTNLVRLRERVPRGIGLTGRVPTGQWKTGAFVAALRRGKMVEGAITGGIFRAHVEQCLVPSLKCKDIVVMDNFAAHKVVGLREMIEKGGASVRCLPKSSPDLNPIYVDRKPL